MAEVKEIIYKLFKDYADIKAGTIGVETDAGIEFNGKGRSVTFTKNSKLYSEYVKKA